MKKNSKRILLIVLAIIIAGVAIRGTIAWLTATSELKNSFTVGKINDPEKGPNDQTLPSDFKGNLYEPSWDSSAEHVLIPGIKHDKDPYVGIGKGSEDAVVYVYIENNYANTVYFTLNSGWEAVEGTFTKAGSKEGTYTSGLFKYTAGLSGATNKDVWTTTPVFSEVAVDDNATIADLTTDTNEIVVKSFIHQAKDGGGQTIPEATILAAAKEAFGI